MKRKGIKGWFKNSYSLQEASLDGLVDKIEWNTQARHLLKFRARALTIAQAFPDVLGGLGCHDQTKIPDTVEEVVSQSVPGPLQEERKSLHEKFMAADSSINTNSTDISEAGRKKIMEQFVLR